MSEATPAEGQSNQRAGADRRKRPTPMLSRHSFFGGRRTGDRRKGPQEGSFVDRYHLPLFLFLLFVLVFNVVDCGYTLHQLYLGATEVNPFARYLLSYGPTFFVLSKCLGVGLILCFICIHKNFKYGRWTLAFSLAVYLGISLYHMIIYLFSGSLG